MFFVFSHLPDYPEHQDGHVEWCHQWGGRATVASSWRWQHQHQLTVVPPTHTPTPHQTETDQNIPELWHPSAFVLLWEPRKRPPSPESDPPALPAVFFLLSELTSCVAVVDLPTLLLLPVNKPRMCLSVFTCALTPPPLITLSLQHRGGWVGGGS